MPNVPNSQQVRFSPVQGQVADFVLNHPTASPFQKYNISFHIGGSYLKDFSKQGIKDFVSDNNDKLSHQEVNAFIQSAATNAPQIAGASFDLSDRELGLYKKDGVNEQHIRTGFALETKSGSLPSQGVVFFDASKATFPLKDAEQAIEAAEKKVKSAEKGLDKADDKLKDAQWERQSLVDFLGKDSPKQLAEKQGRVGELSGRLQELGGEKSRYADELAKLETDHNNGVETPGMSQGERWKRITELKRAMRGLDAETSDSSRELDKTKKSISDKQGPLSFMGIGNSLGELDQRNKNLKQAQDNLQNSRQSLDAARRELSDAKSLRERILKGDSLWPAQPAAPKPPEPPAAPPQPPEQPPAPPAQPAQPAQPVAETPVAPSQPEEPVAPQPAVQPPAQPVAEQPKPPAQPPAQPAHPQPDFTPDEPILPGNQHNPIVSEKPIFGPSQPAQPPVQQPAPVAEPPQPAPVSPPSGPSPIGNGSVSKILYTVKRGDTLSSIAQNQLGSWKRWHEIADMNKQVIGNSNTHWIYPGQVLTLPPLNVKPRPTS